MTQRHIPKGYKQTELGIIPEDWEVKAFMELAVPSVNRINPKVNGGGDFCVELECIPKNGGRLISYIETNKNSSLKGTFDKEDVLFGKLRAYLRKYWFANRSGVCSTEIWVLRVVKQSVFSKFVYYIVQTNKFIELASEAYGTHMPRADWNVIREYRLALPPKPEQKAIARVLSDVDGLIDRLKALIDKKQAMKTATMQQLLTGKTRLPAFQNHPDGTPKSYKQSELGPVPEDWEVKRLGGIGIALIGLTYSPRDISELGKIVLRSSNIQNNRLVFTDNIFVNMDFPERVIVKNNDILICVRNGSRQLIGKCALITKEVEGMAFGAFMSVYRSIYNKFIFHMFQSDCLQKQINENMGATINQITSSGLSNFLIFFPPPPEQTAIATILSDMDHEINALKEQLTKTEKLKQGMMQELLTGKTRLLTV